MRTKIIEVNNVIQNFVWIEPGTFLMGCPKDSSRYFKDDIEHKVTLTKGFWLADTACTQALWYTVMGYNLSQSTQHTDNPVNNVSWNNVSAFFEVFNEYLSIINLKLKASLPTEAEWEYACRAGTTGDYSLQGVDVRYNIHHTEPSIFHPNDPVPVKYLPPNPWGLYEMHGNVWEWCMDWFGDYPKKPRTDPIGSPEGGYKVLRGGSYRDSLRSCSSPTRSCNIPTIIMPTVGFRIKLFE